MQKGRSKKARHTQKSRSKKAWNTQKNRTYGKKEEIRGNNRERNGSRTESKFSVSQNFITDQQLIRRLIRLSTLTKKDTVLEIGTGKGHLTEALCKEAGYVYSVEIDRRLFESAGKRLAQQTNLKLIRGDFLQYHLPEKENYLVFANIPYNITTQIIEKLTNAVNKPKEIWLIMEKGAAKRFMGRPRETEKSLLLKVCWDTEICWHFRREDFHPMPSVDSVLLHFSLKPIPDLNKKECADFRRFIIHCMRYGVCGKRGLLTDRQAEAALKRAGLPHAHEDGVTLYIQWLCLFRCWQEQGFKR